MKLISYTFENLSKGGPTWLTWYWTLFDAIWYDFAMHFVIGWWQDEACSFSAVCFAQWY